MLSLSFDIEWQIALKLFMPIDDKKVVDYDYLCYFILLLWPEQKKKNILTRSTVCNAGLLLLKAMNHVP